MKDSFNDAVAGGTGSSIARGDITKSDINELKQHITATTVLVRTEGAFLVLKVPRDSVGMVFGCVVLLPSLARSTE